MSVWQWVRVDDGYHAVTRGFLSSSHFVSLSTQASCLFVCVLCVSISQNVLSRLLTSKCFWNTNCWESSHKNTPQRIESNTSREKEKGLLGFLSFFLVVFFFKINKWGGCVVRQEHISSLGVENFPSAGFSAKMRNTETLLDKRTSVKKAELSNLLRRVLKS